MIERARLALVVADSLDEPTLHALEEACARLDAGVALWNGEGTTELDGQPALVVSGLAPGARRLPDAIVELADRRFPGTQVLLVCNEPLMRPMLSLQQGRLTLVEPPATVERMASRIRLLLTDEPETHGGSAVGLARPAPGSFAGREFRRSGWWAAALSCAGPRGESPAPHPWLGVDTGLTAVMTAPEENVNQRAVERAVDILLEDAGGGDGGERLGRALGVRAGLVHLTADGQSWLIYWPVAHQPLWLFSTQRLPRWSNLTGGSEHALWRLPAASGDVIAGLSAAEPFAASPTGVPQNAPQSGFRQDVGWGGPFALPSTRVSAAMLDGGPALLALFEASLAAEPQPFSCVLVEVR